MIRNVFFTALLAGAVATAGAAASSDVAGPTLVVGKGTVMVSNGSQFVTAKPGQVLKPGDRVMVLQGASATVNYGNGRASALPPGSLSDIGSMTAVAAAGSKKIGPIYAQAVGDRDDRACRDKDGHVIRDSNGRPVTNCRCRDNDEHDSNRLDSDGHERKCGGYYSGEEHLYAIVGAAAVIGAIGIGLGNMDISNDHPISAP